MTAYELRSYPGGAPDTTLAAGIGSGTLAFTVAAGTGTNYPDGSAGPFYVVIDYDNTSAEKLRCTSRTGDVFTVADRGVDGTTALSHDAPAKVRACWTATDAQEANRAAHYTVGQVTTKGDLLVGTGSAALARLAVGSNGQIPMADSTQATGWKWSTPKYGPGYFASFPPCGLTQANVNNNRTYYTRVRADESFSLTGLKFATVGGVSTVYQCGLYADSSGAPAARLASGSVTTAASGVQSVTFSAVAITAGTVYWLAFTALAAGTVAVLTNTISGASTILPDFARYEDTAMPATATPLTPVTTTFPYVYALVT